MFKKALHRITVVWCLYGLGRLCIFVNPWVFRVAKIFKPVFEDNSEYEFLDNIPWDSSSIEQNLVLWFAIFLGAFILFFAYCGVHHFANWFFNTEKED